jgi:hypothetical protein
MIDINLLEPRTVEAFAGMAASRASGRSWPWIVLVNILILATLLALILFLPDNTPVVGKYLQPARVALGRLSNIF